MKNRYILYIVCILMLLPFAYASLDLDAVKIYVSNERITSADEDGGDIRVYRNDILELSVKVNNDVNSTTKVKILSVLEGIDGGDDIEKNFDWFDISADDDKTKILSYVIPSAASYDEYDLNLKIYYQYTNGSETKGWDIDYTVDVRDVVVTEEEKTESLQDTISNLTNVCGGIASTVNTCFGYISLSQNVSSELSTCKEQRGTYSSNYNNAQESLDECNSQLTSETNLKNVCVTEKTTMLDVDSCDRLRREDVNKAKSESTTMLMWIGGGGLLLWWWNKRKKDRGSNKDLSYLEHRINN